MWNYGRVSENIVDEGYRTAQIRAYNVKSDSKQLGITALLRSADQDLS
jgi:hypothetical protein